MMISWRGFLLFTVTPGLAFSFGLWAFRLIPAWGMVAGALALPALALACAVGSLIIDAVRQ
jgi:hypothetical protein